MSVTEDIERETMLREAGLTPDETGAWERLTEPQPPSPAAELLDRVGDLTLDEGVQ